MSDKEFLDIEQLMGTEPPPEDIAKSVTPWGRAMSLALTGLALTVLTLNFMALDYILPIIGHILCILGFRSLRRENAAFRACFCLTLIRAAYFISHLTLATTVYFEPFFETDGGKITIFINMALTFTQLLCLRKGLKTVQESIGVEPDVRHATALCVWYLIVMLLSMFGLQGTLAVLAIIVSYIIILCRLFALARSLDGTGYAFRPTAPRISDRAVAIALVCVMVGGMALGYGFGSKYRMSYQPIADIEDSTLLATRAKLIDLGFPEKLLDELEPEELGRLQNAKSVMVKYCDSYSNNNGELRMKYDGVAVELDDGLARVYNFFAAPENMRFCGTECFGAQTGVTNGTANTLVRSELCGRVLFDRGGETVAAQYHSLGTVEFENAFLGQGNYRMAAAFSVPKGAEHVRGYIAYDFEFYPEDNYISSHMTFTHQQNLVQFPAHDAQAEQQREFSYFGLDLDPFTRNDGYYEFYEEAVD